MRGIGPGARVLRALEWLVAGRPTAAPQPSLGVVVVGWDEVETARLLEVLAPVTGALASRTVLVANRPLPGLVAGQTVVSGSNSAAEFSGFTEGIASFATRPDVWLLVNDRCLSYDDGVLGLLTPELVRFAATTPVLLGHLDTTEPSEVLGLPVTSWVRSNYAMLSDEVLQQLGGVRTVDPALLPEQAPRSLLELAGDDLPAAYLERLQTWLTVPGRDSWYRATPLTEQSWPLLRRKALCILDEQLLSARAVAAGVRLVGPEQAALLARLPGHSEVRQQQWERLSTEPRFGHERQYDRKERLRTVVSVLREKVDALRPG